MAGVQGGTGHLQKICLQLHEQVVGAGTAIDSQHLRNQFAFVSTMSQGSSPARQYSRRSMFNAGCWAATRVQQKTASSAVTSSRSAQASPLGAPGRHRGT